MKKGDKVCLMLPNIPVFLAIWLALTKIGGVIVPINTSFKASETQYIINHSEARYFIAYNDYLQIALQAQKICSHLECVICIGSSDLPHGVIDYELLIDRTPKEINIDINDDDPSCIIYTSGTTGYPKGVVHINKTPVLTGEAFVIRAGLSAEDRLMVILPLFHQNALLYSIWGTIAAEASLVLIPRFSASQFWNQAVQYKVTEFNFVYAIGRILCNRPQSEFRPEHSIKTAIGVGVSPDVYDGFTQRFKIKNVVDAYGLSEVPCVCQNPIGGKIKLKSIGLPAKMPKNATSSVEMKIVDKKGGEVATGIKGELIVKSPLIMKEYFKDPNKTKESIINGWFYTGDYTYRDDEGYFFFVGRRKDIIRRRGENISPTEIENVINDNPKVMETAVLGIPAELGEEDIMACIVIKPQQSTEPKEIMDWCQGRLAAFKLPRYIQFCKILPKTATQRVKKHILRKNIGPKYKTYDMQALLKM